MNLFLKKFKYSLFNEKWKKMFFPLGKMEKNNNVEQEKWKNFVYDILQINLYYNFFLLS